MLEPGQHEPLLACLIESGRLENARVVTPAELAKSGARRRTSEAGETEVEGALVLTERRVPVRVVIGEDFPVALPQIFICEPETLGVLPHVEFDGRICYADSEGILIDQDYPFDVLVAALELARRTLESGLRGNNNSEFVRELPAYILQRPDHIQCPCYVTADDTLRSIIVSTRGRQKRLIYIADSESDVKSFFNGQRWRRTHVSLGIYVPLLSSAVEEVSDPNLFTNAQWVRKLITKHLSAENWTKLQKIKRLDRPDPVVVFKIPRGDGGASLLGVRFHDVQAGQSLLDSKEEGRATPVVLHRRSADVLVPRGGGELSLHKKHVILVGCGAVGGYIALALAQAGVGRMTLVDPDLLEAQNAFRHILGHNGLGQQKVIALRWELERKLPFIQVAAIPGRIERILRLKPDWLALADLVIMATGSPTLSLYVNRYLYSSNGKVPMLFTWLEPYGIGGHALLTQPEKRSAGAYGCLQCLFIRKPPDDELVNQANFAARGQRFSKDLAGCGSLYTPYSSLDAIRTAELATRLAVQALRSEELGCPLLSWRGSDAYFVAHGYRTTARHQLSEEALFNHRYGYVNANCTICSVHNHV